MTIEELLDRESIRDVLADYSVTKDLGLGIRPSVETFLPEGELVKSDGTVLKGREQIEEFFTTIAEKRNAAGGPDAFARHVLFPCRFDFQSSDDAETVTYLLTFTENGLDQIATYYDSFHKRDGRWFIKRRRIEMEFQLKSSRLVLPEMVIRGIPMQPPPPSEGGDRP